MKDKAGNRSGDCIVKDLLRGCRLHSELSRQSLEKYIFGMNQGTSELFRIEWKIVLRR